MLMVTVWPGSVRLCPRCRSKRLATQRRCCAQCKGARRERCWGCLAPNAVPGGVGKVCTLHTQIHLTLHKREYPQYTLDSNQPPSAATAPCHALMYKTDGTVKWPKPSAHGRASLCLGMYDVHACTCDDECVHRQEPSPATTHQRWPTHRRRICPSTCRTLQPSVQNECYSITTPWHRPSTPAWARNPPFAA